MKAAPELFAGAEVRYWDVAPAVYQADRSRVRRTHLELVRKSTRLYEHRVILGNAEPESKALRIGRALHVEVLQPELVEHLLVSTPKFNLRSNAGKDQLRTWRADLSPDAIVLSHGERETVRRMAEALRSDPLAAPLLERDGATELPLEWVDPETGLPCKCMLDKYFETLDGRAARVLDLKSSIDPTEDAFAKAVAKFGYHRQDAMYRDAAQRYAGGRPTRFIFIVVRNAPPYEVAVYDLDDDAVNLGRHQIRAALSKLARHSTLGQWRDSWQGAGSKPNTISLPKYAFKDAP